jgi:hypothetical protein
MSNRSVGSPHHKRDIQELGFYSTYGGLLVNGESTCTSIRIVCERKSEICRTATAVTASLLGHAQVVAVSMSYDYNVTKWADDIISAENHNLGLGSGTGYLHIVIKDTVPDEIKMINILQSLIAKRGEWITEVFTVGNDPSFEKLLNPKER